MSQPHESRVYSDLARFYDFFFGRVFVDREHEVIEGLNLRPGNRVLEVGVGTGIALDAYPPYAHIVAIDPSADMLERAKKRVAENGWGHIELKQGDALNLDYPDNSFDYVTSFHVLTVVPDPYRMMSEMVRVCKPGGRIAITTHFQSANPVVALLNTIVNPITRQLGWTTRLRKQDVLKGHPITLEHSKKISRWSVHSLIIARKNA
ncbi:MAG: methyltransferase domain-containing protein [Candidatus Binatus sp.]|jgi:phosphatidylethanolamine/phosphatidyl-N-methylethanolamine N-methyltransferase|uniref:class I SAM-dependent methyltransferase n=1 Tax=Candidatus Binatus sp. TaxID=2811406 RepID=UPI003C9AD3AD